MDFSGYLISLSDSGAEAEQSVASSSSCRTCFDSMEDLLGTYERAPRTMSMKGKAHDSEGSELLVDLTDAVQVPQQTGILLQAEIDDTFGLFSGGSCKANKGKSVLDSLREEEGDDEAAKLVRSFTSGRKSEVNRVDKIEKNRSSIEDQKRLEDKLKTVDVSVESIDSDAPTVVSDDYDAVSPKSESDRALYDNTQDEDEEGIMGTKMDLTGNSTTSGGSDSDILDPNNLSSFSIPEEEINAFYEDVKKKDMKSTETKTIMNQIKLEMLQEEAEMEAKLLQEDVPSRCNRLSSASSVAGLHEDIGAENKLLSEVSAVSFASTASSRYSRLSTASSVASVGLSSTRLSVCAQKSNEGEPYPPKQSRGRLSSNFGSPIRGSHPVNRFFCPTPHAKTPSAAASSSRNEPRDRLSEALFSPSRTRVMLITGDNARSPSRVPVRKSISAETLHFEYASPVRKTMRHSIKFSTPAANPQKSRHSFSVQPVPFPNIFGDDRPDCAPAETTLTDMSVGSDWDRHIFMDPRKGRLSYASTASTTSIATLSPAGSSIYSHEVNLMTGQMNRMNLNQTRSSSIQPVKATAVIAPSKPAKSMHQSQSNQGEPNKTVSFNMPTKLPPQGTSLHGSMTSASSKVGPSPGRPSMNQTTPSRSRYGLNVRSSGYGIPQTLSTSSAGGKAPLKSPNPPAGMKAPAATKSMKPSVLSFGAKPGTKTRDSISGRSTVSALKPPGKLVAPGSSGLRRPSVGGATCTSNKENKLKAPGTRPSMPRPLHR